MTIPLPPQLPDDFVAIGRDFGYTDYERETALKIERVTYDQDDHRWYASVRVFDEDDREIGYNSSELFTTCEEALAWLKETP